ncbi:Aspartokinase I/homoserine dehydrogenase I [Serratia liquefaciens]|nr:Aspartokinase I/homoserine dehydrogenase I [Serratia liquefaciens]
MRVLKFGGTSVANAERFLRVADILESNARQGQVATVLSAPAKITNHLVAMIEKTIGGQDALPNIADAERIFAELLQGLADAQPAFPLAQLKAFVEQEFAQIKHVLHGISLLGQCPDSVNAALICRGEKLSIAIMAGLLEAVDIKSVSLTRSKNCSPWATIWNPPSISPNPPAALPPARSRQTI